METDVIRNAKLRKDLSVVIIIRVTRMSVLKYAETILIWVIYNVRMVISLIMMDVIIYVK
jgi:hypothetical protein